MRVLKPLLMCVSVAVGVLAMFVPDAQGAIGGAALCVTFGIAAAAEK